MKSQIEKIQMNTIVMEENGGVKVADGMKSKKRFQCGGKNLVTVLINAKAPVS